MQTSHHVSSPLAVPPKYLRVPRSAAPVEPPLPASIPSSNSVITPMTGRRCGTPGCTLPDFHSGLCTSAVLPAKRQSSVGSAGSGSPRDSPPPARMNKPTAKPPAASSKPAGAVGSKAAAAAAGGDGDGLLGKRKVKATTVMIGGHAVKRQNLYDMEEGEGSVWDRELSGKTDAAFEYKDRVAPKAAAAAASAGSANHAAKKQKPSSGGPKKQSAEEKERLERNEMMRSAKNATSAARYQFLEPHREVLQRFGASLPKAPSASSSSSSSSSSGFVVDESIEQPSEILVPMRDYQLHGLRWLTAMHTSGVNAILADEMGLGKTLQTISFLAHLKFNLGVSGPHLVICPLSVLSSWMSELKRFCPKLAALKLHSSDQEERKRLMASVASGASEIDVVVTTYEMAKSPNVHSQLASRSWWRYSDHRRGPYHQE